MNKLRQESQAPKALNYTARSHDAREENKQTVINAQVRLGSETLTSPDIGSDLTIASPELKDFSQDIEPDQVFLKTRINFNFLRVLNIEYQSMCFWDLTVDATRRINLTTN